jgi:RNA 2',3'-cyclic 3'-phosphodiesterase
MSFIGVRVPHEVARLLDQVKVPGECVPTHEKHITVLYLGKEVPLEQVGHAVVAAAEIASKVTPFRCTVESYTCFPKGDDGVPIISPVISPELHTLNETLKKAFDEANVTYSKKFPEYKPHVTLSYATEPVDTQPMGPLEWSVYEMVLWGGDAGDDRLAVTFPFAMPVHPTEQKIVQAMSRIEEANSLRRLAGRA